MKNKIIYFDIAKNSVMNGLAGGITMTKPSIIYGSTPNFEFHFIQESETVDLSEATAWQCSIDTDFNLSTDPMTRTLNENIDSSGAASGIIIASIDTNTEKFQTVVNGKDTVAANCEIRGFSSTGATIYCMRFAIACWGAVDIQAISSVVIPDNVASKSYVTAVTSGFQRQIDGLSGGLDDVVEVVEDLSGTVTTVTGYIGEIQTISGMALENAANIELVSGDVSTLSTTVSRHTGNIVYLSAAIDAITPSGITELREDVDTISGNLSSLSTTVNDHIANTVVHVTAEEKAIWNAKSSFDGNYNSLSNRPDLTIYETTVSADYMHATLSTQIQEISGKIPSNVGVPVTFVTSSYAYDGDTDAGKIFFINEEEGTSFYASGDLSPIYKHELSGHNAYMALSGIYWVSGDTTKIDDLTLYSQPASGLAFTGTCDGTDRTFVYYGTYLNSSANVRFPIWKDSGSNYYLFPGTNWSGNWEWSIASYLPADGTNPMDCGLYFSSAKFSVGSLLHPKVEDFNHSKWQYDDGPYNRTVSLTQTGGGYPNFDILTDYVNLSVSGQYTLNDIQMTEGSGTITYTDTYTSQEVTKNYYTLSYRSDDSSPGLSSMVNIWMGYNSGTQGVPGTIIKCQITQGSTTYTFGKYAACELSGTNWPTVLSGEMRDYAYISGWYDTEFNHAKVTLYDVEPTRKGHITTTTPGHYDTVLKFARIPIEMPEPLIF